MPFRKGIIYYGSASTVHDIGNLREAFAF